VAGVQRAARGDITIVLDDVTFIDAAGLGAVADASSAQSARGARLSVTGVTAKIRRMFELGQLTGLLRAS
jgi:anti-anti-sigma factor